MMMRSNVPEVIMQMIRPMAELDSLIKVSQESLGKFVSELRGLSGGRRGIASLVETMEKLSGVKLGGSLLSDVHQLATAQAGLARSARETAEAYREIAASARRANGGGVGVGLGGGGRRGGGGVPPAAPGPFGANDDFLNAGAMNTNRDQVYRNQRALADYENAGRDAAARRSQAAADARFRDDYALAHRQEADNRARERARGHSHTSLVDAGMGLGMAGDAGLGFFERSIKAELEVRKLMAAFHQNTTISEAEIAEVRSKAEALVRSVPGTTVAENLHTILDAYTVTGELHEALGGSEAMSKLNLLLSSLPGAHSGDPGFAAAQAVELMQKFYNPQTHAVDINALNHEINAIAAVAAGTNNRMSPEAYLAFTKQARVASMTASDKFLYQDAPAAMIAMGGSRFGTGLAALFAEFQTGTMTKNTFAALRGFGLVDRTAKWHGGRATDIGHHLLDAQLNATNMVDWVRKDILGPEGILARRGIDPNDKVAVARALSSFTGRQTGLGVLAELVLGMGGVDKEAGKLQQQNANPLAVLQANDPNMKVKEFEAAQNELMVQFGSALMGPAIEGMKALTTALRDLTDWARNNPNAAKDLVLIGGGMTVLAAAAGQLATVVFIGAPVIAGLRAMTGAIGGLGGTISGFLARIAAAGVPSAAPAVTTPGILSTLAAAGARLLPPAAAFGAWLGITRHLNPLTNAQAERNAPQLAAPHDGPIAYTPSGVPITNQSYHLPAAPGAAHYLHASYERPIHVVVHNSVELDGEVVHRSVQRRRNRDADRPPTGPASFDARLGTLYNL